MGRSTGPCSALCCCTARLIRLTGCLTVLACRAAKRLDGRISLTARSCSPGLRHLPEVQRPTLKICFNGIHAPARTDRPDRKRKMARVWLRLTDIGRIHAVQDGLRSMCAGDILRTEAEEHAGHLTVSPSGMPIRPRVRRWRSADKQCCRRSRRTALVDLELGERL